MADWSNCSNCTPTNWSASTPLQTCNFLPLQLEASRYRCSNQQSNYQLNGTSFLKYNYKSHKTARTLTKHFTPKSQQYSAEIEQRLVQANQYFESTVNCSVPTVVPDNVKMIPVGPRLNTKNIAVTQSYPPQPAYRIFCPSNPYASFRPH